MPIELNRLLIDTAKALVVEDGCSVYEAATITGIPPHQLTPVAKAENWKHCRREYLARKYSDDESSPVVTAETQELRQMRDDLISVLGKWVRQVSIQPELSSKEAAAATKACEVIEKQLALREGRATSIVKRTSDDMSTGEFAELVAKLSKTDKKVSEEPIQ